MLSNLDNKRNHSHEVRINNNNNYTSHSNRVRIVMRFCLWGIVPVVFVLVLWTVQQYSFQFDNRGLLTTTSLKPLVAAIGEYSSLSSSNTDEREKNYHPDLTFALSNEENNKRLDFIHGVPSHRTKETSLDNNANVDSKSSSSDEFTFDDRIKEGNNERYSAVNGDDDSGGGDINDIEGKNNLDFLPNLAFALTREQNKERLDFISTRKNSPSIAVSDKSQSGDESRFSDIEYYDDSLEDHTKRNEDENDHELDRSSPPLCTRNEILEGKWIREVLDKPPYITPTVHLRCYPSETYYNSSNGWNTWNWQPNAMESGKCKFDSSFTKKEFCKLMQDSVISIVGDSLSWEHYSSLVQLNGVRTHQTFQHQSHELQMNIFQPVCNGRTKVLYRYDDKLQNLTSSLQDDFPVVLVLNRGAHYKPDEDLLPAIRNNIGELKNYWIPKCEMYKIKCHLFWRTSVPGHPGCFRKVSQNNSSKPVFTMAYNEPVNDLQQMENLINDLSNYDNRSINYHWYDYQHQNELVIREFQDAFRELSETSPYFQFEILDAYYLNVLRPDEHRAHQEDCLHNCYPSKMDIYSVLMVHYLLQQRSNEDVATLRALVTKKNLWNVNETTKHDREATDKARKAREGGNGQTRL